MLAGFEFFFVTEGFTPDPAAARGPV